jgi:hypothetical protein
MRDHRNLIKDTIKKKDTSGSEVQRSKANIAERVRVFFSKKKNMFLLEYRLRTLGWVFHVV